jgi:hypothetical protein
MNDIEMDWITRIETPCETVVYLSAERRQLLLASRRIEAGGEPLAAVDLTNPMSGELTELKEMTRWYLAEHVDAGDPTFAAVFDFGHPVAGAILTHKHPMVGLGLVGAPEILLSKEDYEAGRAVAIEPGGGVELLPISADLGPLVEGHEISHLALVLAVEREAGADA